jgi:hypothetical protein
MIVIEEGCRNHAEHELPPNENLLRDRSNILRHFGCARSGIT